MATSTEEKIKIIDQICEKHPSYGVDRGWSCYTGGMADTGNWYFRKMLDEPMEVLQLFLNNINDEERKPKQESKLTQREAAIKFHQDIERRLLFGE